MAPVPFTLILEPVKHCNLACRHCYSDVTREREVMSEAVLVAPPERAFGHCRERRISQLIVLWHGGEPLLAGLEFYQRAAEHASRLAGATTCRHLMQTNGLLLDEAFCRFFVAQRFEIGISLDGPPQTHDRLRVDSRGEGTHHAVCDRLELARRQGLGFGLASVISRASPPAEVLAQYQWSMNAGLRVNPLFPGQVPEQVSELLLAPGEYGRYLCALFDACIADDRPGLISPLDSYMRAIVLGEDSECQHARSCVGSQIAIKPDGAAVLCSRFETPVLGSIVEQPIQQLLQAPFCRTVDRRAAEQEPCNMCPNFAICHGGCPHNCIATGGELLTRDPFCEDYQRIFSHLRRALWRADAEPCPEGEQ